MRSNNALVIALIVSLAANLALAGFVVGRMSAPGPAPAAMDPFLGSLRAMHRLPEERQAEIRPLLREHFRSLRPSVREMRRAQRHVNEALAREPFDPAALDDALTGFRGVLLQSQERSHEALIQLAATLRPEERIVLREVMTRGARGGATLYRERHRDRADPPDGLNAPPGR
jgi:uncharacterized membrane protein